MKQRAECNSLSWCSQKKQITLSDPKYPDSIRPPALVHITFWPSKNIIRVGVRGAVKKKSLSWSFRFSLWTVGIISQSLPSQPLPWLINIAQKFCSFAKNLILTCPKSPLGSWEEGTYASPKSCWRQAPTVSWCQGAEGRLEKEKTRRGILPPSAPLEPNADLLDFQTPTPSAVFPYML